MVGWQRWTLNAGRFVAAGVTWEKVFRWNCITGRLEQFTQQSDSKAVDFSSSESEKSVFLVGRINAEETQRVGGQLSFTLFVSGNWPFSNSKAVEMAAKVLKSTQP